MNRNPIIPFVLIMVFGVGLMFLMSFKGVGDMKEIAAEEENGGAETEDLASATPEELYQQSGCVSCHGGNYEGGMGPALTGVGDHLSQEEIQDILTNGKGSMPPGLVQGREAEMAEWLAGLK
ncbi:cytochrome c550 [Robertmurraya massiliosenegalensis]|uniref:cytochrome c550 n=1 Tax=Robertmurraya TaxID=2837507 RepID=UPI0039A5B6B4